MRLAIVIAAYNEASSIAATVASIPGKIRGARSRDIIVVNDGSEDATEELALKAGAVVLSHPINRGQGAALQTGLEYARKRNYDVVVTFDADGQHDGKEIADMVAPIVAGEVEVTLGSRFIGADQRSNVPAARKLVLKGGVLFTTFFSRIKITDTHNGFRAFSKEALKAIRIRQDRMEHASEILDQVSAHRISYREVPVTIRYTEYSRSKGQSNANAVRIAMRMLLYKMAR